METLWSLLKHRYIFIGEVQIHSL